MPGFDAAQRGIADEYDDGHNLQVWIHTQDLLDSERMAYRLLDGVVQVVLGDVGVGFPPFPAIGDVGHDDLGPFLAVVVAVDFAAVVLGLDGKHAVF